MPYSRWVTLLLMCGPCFSQTTPAPFNQLQGTPTPPYQMQFVPPPTDGASASSTIAQRASEVIRYEACGDELGFLSAQGQDVGEGVISMAIAKLTFAAPFVRTQQDNLPQPGQPLPPTGAFCTFERIYSVDDAAAKFPDPGVWADLPRTDAPASSPAQADLIIGSDAVATLAARFATAFYAQFGCVAGDFSAAFQLIPATNPDLDPVLLDVKFSLSQRCMVQQLNTMVPTWKVVDYAGSSGIPCLQDAKFSVPGEWDTKVKDLTRLYYLNQRYQVLSETARTHIRDKLLTLDGYRDQDDYSVLQCGNTGDQDTGSPDQRAAANVWNSNTVTSIENGIAWLLKRLLILLAFDPEFWSALEALGAGSTAGDIASVAAMVSPDVVAGAEVLTLTTIPETENHLLMMESSRYLNNLVIAQEMPASNADDAATYRQFAAKGKEWLLQRMQRILKEDFLEYNARPYQRYSIQSILNLYDFSNDPQLRTMAQMVLEYASLKFAIGSLEGRRSVPFRRRQEVTDGVTSMMELADGDDFQVAMMLVLAGQTQQLPVNPTTKGSVSVPGAGEMVSIATSTFVPDPAVLDLAVRKDIPYYQQLSHSGGVEIYSGASSYVISAGGFETPSPYSVSLVGVDLGSSQVDHGAGVPTALLLAAGTGAIDRLNLVRIEGLHQDYGSSGSTDHPDWHNTSYQNNTCVWAGFACGTNLVIPDSIATPPLASTNSKFTPNCSFDDRHPWYFFNSQNCDPSAPRVYVAVYELSCPPGDQSCQTVIGFLEAVDNPPQGEDYETFQNNVTIANPLPFKTATTGTYHSQSGHAIDFDCEAYANNSKKWGIVAVDGVAQPDLDTWPFASGSIVSADGNGTLTINNPRTRVQIKYDFTNADNPVRTIANNP